MQHTQNPGTPTATMQVNATLGVATIRAHRSTCVRGTARFSCKPLTSKSDLIGTEIICSKMRERGVAITVIASTAEVFIGCWMGFAGKR
jgi:hypothetical protein